MHQLPSSPPSRVGPSPSSRPYHASGGPDPLRDRPRGWTWEITTLRAYPVASAPKAGHRVAEKRRGLGWQGADFCGRGAESEFEQAL